MINDQIKNFDYDKDFPAALKYTRKKLSMWLFDLNGKTKIFAGGFKYLGNYIIKYIYGKDPEDEELIEDDFTYKVGEVFTPVNIISFVSMMLENVSTVKDEGLNNRQFYIVSNKYRYLHNEDRVPSEYTLSIHYNGKLLKEIESLLKKNGYTSKSLMALTEDEATLKKLNEVGTVYCYIKDIENRIYSQNIDEEHFGVFDHRLDPANEVIENNKIIKIQPSTTYFITWVLLQATESLIKILNDLGISKSADKFGDSNSIIDVANKYAEIYSSLRTKIYGQDQAIENFVKGLYSSSMNKDPEMPFATYLFVGPPGVGKTFLAKQVADLLDRPYKIFQMNQYTDNNSVHDFVGFAGTWKSAKDGELTSFVKSNPNAVLLFDEIEKAHTNVIRLFLSVLEGAFLESLYTGEKVDFSNTICIFTTNAGRDYFDSHYGEDFSLISQPALIDIIKNDLAPKSDGTNDLSKDGLTAFPAEILSRFAKGNMVAFSHMSIEKLVPLVKKGLGEGAQIIKDELNIEVNYDKEMLPYLFLYTMGSKLDARVATSNSRTYIIDITYKILGRISQEQEKYRQIESITLTIDKNDEVAATYTKMTDKKHVVIACKGEYRDSFLKGKNKKTGETAKHIWHYVYSQKEVDEYGNEYEKHIREAVEENNIEAAFIDFTFGENASSKNIGDGLSYINSQGSRIFRWLKENHPDVPVFAISIGNELGLSDKKLLRDDGVKDFFVFKNEENDALAQIDNVCYGQFLQERMDSLVRKGQVLKFDTATKLSGDGKNIDVLLHQFEPVRNLDNEADELFVTSDDVSNVNFDTIIGAEEAKKELKRFIKYIQNPKEYLNTGLKVSRGILLYGPPGTGKTMLAKALANEADCPFISITGAQVVKGEQSIRKAFAAARRYSPSILFIDEIDAFALDRQTGQGYTVLVNELLTNMDGFEDTSSKPVFVIAATNFGSRASINGENISLDAAVLRRFANRIYISIPGKEGIEKWLNNKKNKLKGKATNLEALSDSDISFIAEMTVGSSLSELDDVLNQAGAEALARQCAITKELFVEVFQERKYGVKLSIDESDMLRTARHEAGHAVVGYLEGGELTPVYATITGRADFLGYVKREHNENAVSHTKEKLLGKIRMSLAGRASELVFYGSEDGLDSGISNDLKNASSLALAMVTTYGMSEDRLFYFSAEMANRFGASISGSLIDEYAKEADAILKREMEKTIKIIEEHKDLVDKFANELLNKGDLAKEDIENICKE